MRLIDADELIKDRVSNDPVVIATLCEPTIDAVPVVRCKNCKYAFFYPMNTMYECGQLEDRLMFPDDFCSYGVKMDEGE